MRPPCLPKFSEYKEKLFKTYRFQLVFYVRPIQENFNVPVQKGFIVYTRSRNKLVEIEIADKDLKKLEKTVNDMIDVIQNCQYPKPTSTKKRCPDCCYKNICEGTI